MAVLVVLRINDGPLLVKLVVLAFLYMLGIDMDGIDEEYQGVDGVESGEK